MSHRAELPSLPFPHSESILNSRSSSIDSCSTEDIQLFFTHGPTEKHSTYSKDLTGAQIKEKLLHDLLSTTPKDSPEGDEYIPADSPLSLPRSPDNIRLQLDGVYDVPDDRSLRDMGVVSGQVLIARSIKHSPPQQPHQQQQQQQSALEQYAQEMPAEPAKKTKAQSPRTSLYMLIKNKTHSRKNSKEKNAMAQITAAASGGASSASVSTPSVKKGSEQKAEKPEKSLIPEALPTTKKEKEKMVTVVVDSPAKKIKKRRSAGQLLAGIVGPKADNTGSTDSAKGSRTPQPKRAQHEASGSVGVVQGISTGEKTSTPASGAVAPSQPKQRGTMLMLQRKSGSSPKMSSRDSAKKMKDRSKSPKGSSGTTIFSSNWNSGLFPRRKKPVRQRSSSFTEFHAANRAAAVVGVSFLIDEDGEEIDAGAGNDKQRQGDSGPSTSLCFAGPANSKYFSSSAGSERVMLSHRQSRKKSGERHKRHRKSSSGSTKKRNNGDNNNNNSGSSKSPLEGRRKYRTLRLSGEAYENRRMATRGEGGADTARTRITRPGQAETKTLWKRGEKRASKGTTRHAGTMRRRPRRERHRPHRRRRRGRERDYSQHDDHYKYGDGDHDKHEEESASQRRKVDPAEEWRAIFHSPSPEKTRKRSASCYSEEAEEKLQEPPEVREGGGRNTEESHQAPVVRSRSLSPSLTSSSSSSIRMRQRREQPGVLDMAKVRSASGKKEGEGEREGGGSRVASPLAPPESGDSPFEKTHHSRHNTHDDNNSSEQGGHNGTCDSHNVADAIEKGEEEEKEEKEGGYNDHKQDQRDHWDSPDSPERPTTPSSEHQRPKSEHERSSKRHHSGRKKRSRRKKRNGKKNHHHSGRHAHHQRGHPRANDEIDRGPESGSSTGDVLHSSHPRHSGSGHRRHKRKRRRRRHRSGGGSRHTSRSGSDSHSASSSGQYHRKREHRSSRDGGKRRRRRRRKSGQRRHYNSSSDVLDRSDERLSPGREPDRERRSTLQKAHSARSKRTTSADDISRPVSKVTRSHSARNRSNIEIPQDSIKKREQLRKLKMMGRDLTDMFVGAQWEREEHSKREKHARKQPKDARTEATPEEVPTTTTTTTTSSEYNDDDSESERISSYSTSSIFDSDSTSEQISTDGENEEESHGDSALQRSSCMLYSSSPEEKEGSAAGICGKNDGSGANADGSLGNVISGDAAPLSASSESRRRAMLMKMGTAGIEEIKVVSGSPPVPPGTTRENQRQSQDEYKGKGQKENQMQGKKAHSARQRNSAHSTSASSEGLSSHAPMGSLPLAPDEKSLRSIAKEKERYERRRKKQERRDMRRKKRNASRHRRLSSAGSLSSACTTPRNKRNDPGGTKTKKAPLRRDSRAEGLRRTNSDVSCSGSARHKRGPSYSRPGHGYQHPSSQEDSPGGEHHHKGKHKGRRGRRHRKKYSRFKHQAPLSEEHCEPSGTLERATSLVWTTEEEQGHPVVILEDL